VDPWKINVIHDTKNPKITKKLGIVAFREGVKHYAMNRGFEFANFKTEGSRWRTRGGGE
jgi:hypothetical protein